MPHRQSIFVLSVLALLLSCAAQARAQSDPGLGTSPFDSPSDERRKEKAAKPPDIYVKKIAERFNAKEDDVTRLWNRGYGRNELIKLLLIMQGSRQKLRDLARMRDRNEKLSKIAGKYGLDYDAILTEASEVRRTIDREITDALPKEGSSVSNGTATVSTGTPEGAVQTSTSTEKKP